MCVRCWSVLLPSITLWNLYNSDQYSLNTFFKQLNRHFLTMFITKYFLEILEIIFSMNMNFWFQQKLMDKNYENWGPNIIFFRKGGMQHREYFLNEEFREDWGILRCISCNTLFHWAPKMSLHINLYKSLVHQAGKMVYFYSIGIMPFMT